MGLCLKVLSEIRYKILRKKCVKLYDLLHNTFDQKRITNLIFIILPFNKYFLILYKFIN